MFRPALQKLLLFAFVAASSYTFALACADDADPEGSDLGGDASTPVDMGKPDTTSPSDMPNSLAYRFIKIEDLDGATSDTTEHLGADIDAVILTKDGTFIPAAAPLSTGGDAAYPEGLAGPQTNPVCIQGAFVSIGTGPMVFALEGDAKIEEGDTLTVYEVGDVECAPSGTDSDDYRVSVSVGSDPDGTWVALTTCSEGVACEATIPSLP